MKKLIARLQNDKRFKKICFYGIIAFLFLYSFSIPAFSGRSLWNIISYIMMAGFAGFTIIYTFLYTKFIFNRWLIIPTCFVLFAFVGTAIFSHSFVGTKGKIGWTSLVLMLLTLVFFYYGFVVINNKRLIFKILLFAFLSFAFYFAFTYRSDIIHMKITSARLGGYFDNVNTIGFYFAILYTLSLYLGLFFERKIELLYLVPSVISLFLGLFTGSRAFLIAIVIGSIAVMYFRLRNKKIIFFLALACLIGLYFVLINIPQLYFLKDQFDRTLYTLFGIGNSKVDTSTIQRAVWPGYGFYLGGRNLLFGYGVNGFSIYSGVGTYAHNNFAEVLCNFGIVGFALFNACFIIPLILSFKAKENEALLVPVLFAIYFFRGFFGVTYYSKEAYLTIALLLFLTKDLSLPTFSGIHFYRKDTENYCEVKI